MGSSLIAASNCLTFMFNNQSETALQSNQAAEVFNFLKISPTEHLFPLIDHFN